MPRDMSVFCCKIRTSLYMCSVARSVSFGRRLTVPASAAYVSAVGKSSFCIHRAVLKQLDGLRCFTDFTYDEVRKTTGKQSGAFSGCDRCCSEAGCAHYVHRAATAMAAWPVRVSASNGRRSVMDLENAASTYGSRLSYVSKGACTSQVEVRFVDPALMS